MGMASKAWVGVVAILALTNLPMGGVQADDDAVDPRFPGRHCFWNGSCPLSGVSTPDECPAPYVTPNVLPSGGPVIDLILDTSRKCLGTGWKNLCCEPLGFISQGQERSDRPPPFGQAGGTPIGPHPADVRPPLGQPSTAAIGPHPADGRPPIGQPSYAPIGPHPTGVPEAPGSRGFGTPKGLPPFGQPASAPTGAHTTGVPKWPGGVAVHTDGGANKSSANVSTGTGGIYQVHPGGSSTTNSANISVKKGQPTKLGKRASAAASLVQNRNSASHRRWRAAMSRHRPAHR